MQYQKTTIVLDTNVLLSGLRSRNGASFRLLQALDSGRFRIVVSTALVLEYEDVLKRNRAVHGLSNQDIDDVLDILCAAARLTKMHYLWRPQLRDPGDEMVLEAAVNGLADYIVTFNIEDFREATRFSLRVVTPQQFLSIIGEKR